MTTIYLQSFLFPQIHLFVVVGLTGCSCLVILHLPNSESGYTLLPCPSFSPCHSLDIFLTLLRSSFLIFLPPCLTDYLCLSLYIVFIFLIAKIKCLSLCSSFISLAVITCSDQKQYKEERIYLVSRSEFITERSQGVEAGT